MPTGRVGLESQHGSHFGRRLSCAAAERKMSDPEVVIRLTVTEAVVLDAFLRRYSETDCVTIADQAEQRALWNLQCVFEKVGDPSWPSLEEARAELRDLA